MTLILLGRITGAHGIRGAVKLKSLTANPADIANYKPLQTSSGALIEILRMKPAKDEFIADLKDVKDRNAAEALKGTELFITRDKLPAAAPGEVYLSDLIGKVVTHNDQSLGSITSIENYGAGDLLELQSGLLIPTRFMGEVTDIVPVTLPDGFLDDEKKP